MSKQNLSETISNVNKYMKNLKQQKVLVNSNPQSFSNSYLAYDHSLSDIPQSHPSNMAFQKTKSKVEVAQFLKEDSPYHAKSSHHSKDKKEMNMNLKMANYKKDIQSQNEREHAFNKSHGRMQIKHLSNLLSNSFGTKEVQIKKNGHSHTYTYLNDMDFDKFSEVDSNFSSKNQKLGRMRHSKSPSKERHLEHNNASYGEEDIRLSYQHRTHNAQKEHKVYEEKRFQSLESSYLLQQIFRLEQSIKQYKMVLLEMKHKYLQMEEKLKEKALNDHYIDVLKAKIQTLQQKNHQLNATLHQKQTNIDECEQVFIDKMKKINEYYQKHEQDRIQLQSENEILRQLLMISGDRQGENLKIVRPKAQENIQTNAYLDTVCKNAIDFAAKWS